MALRFLFIDFNAYFASVEQQLEPAYRGQPVAVVPVQADSSCCIAVSYEARAYGIATGTGVKEAKSRCPHLKLVLARHDVYLRMHRRLVDLLERCYPVDQICSIDEICCRLTGRHQQKEEALRIARRIKQALQEEIGEYLRGSIGIGPNWFLAKMASKMEKPDGLFVIETQDLPHILHRLELEDMWGISSRMSERLRRGGIPTVEALCAASSQTLRQIWGGVVGERYFLWLRGEPLSTEDTHRGSFSHSHVLAPAMRPREKAFSVLHRLLQKAALRMRTDEYYAGRLTVLLRIEKGVYWKKEQTFFETQSLASLSQVLTDLLDRVPREFTHCTQVSLVLGDLVAAHNFTPSLFEPDAARTHALWQTMDRINKKMGGRTLFTASSQWAIQSKAAPTRIAFTRIPNPDQDGEDF